MDRVLLVIDDIQYSRHVEMTLRKVGFDVEAINNEFNLNETVLTFNPDYIIVRGNTNRLSAFNVGKKLKDSTTKMNAKVVLLFNEGFKVTDEDLIKLKMDLLLFEPISTLRLAMHLFSMSNADIEFVKDKLLKFAITDNQFRTYEQQLLRGAGVTIDSEIQIVSAMEKISINQQPNNKNNEIVPSHAAQELNKVNLAEASAQTDAVELLKSVKQSALKINLEINEALNELPLRIDSYNHAIDKVDSDLKLGHKKRQTKKASNKLRKDLIDEGKADTKQELDQDAEKRLFAAALFKK